MDTKGCVVLRDTTNTKRGGDEDRGGYTAICAGAYPCDFTELIIYERVPHTSPSTGGNLQWCTVPYRELPIRLHRVCGHIAIDAIIKLICRVRVATVIGKRHE